MGLHSSNPLARTLVGWFGLLFLVTQLPLYLVRYPDIQDYVNHAARLHIALQLGADPVLTRYYQWTPGIFPNLPLDTIGLGLAALLHLPIVRLFSIGYIELIRGVPLITILYMADILLPLFLDVNVRPDRVIRAMVGFIMFEAAYQAENVRGGLQSIPRGQYEASQALGLNGALTTILVVLPQALRAVVPALFNSFISLFKDTSLVAIIGLFDLLRVGRSVLAQPEWLGTHREVFLFAFVVYWVFNLAFSHGSKRIEEALGVGER